MNEDLENLHRQVSPEPQSTAPQGGAIPTSNSDDEETLARLAALPPLEYERRREEEAQKLGIKRVSVLDQLIDAKRLLSNPRGDNLQGKPLQLADVEPWETSVSGAETLDAIAERFSHYVVLPDGGSIVLALWCAHTHVFKVFEHSPRAIVSAPMHRCGKTLTRNVAACFCNRALKAENLATAVLYRLIEAQWPTILADEFGGWLGENEELRKLLNSGHEKGGWVLRCVGDDHEVRTFAAFAPIMLCGIGALPVELHDRSIVIRLKRAKKGEVQARYDSRHLEYEHELNRKLARWCADNRAAIEACDPQLPERSYGRDADNWRSLFAIAEIVGGNWPERCKDAYTKLTSNEEEVAESYRMMLLADIREIFKAERMFSKDLVDALADLKERPWPEVNRGKPITARWLARNLAAFGIRSTNIRIGEGKDEEQAKGYERTDFDEAFTRYLPFPAKISVPASQNFANTTERSGYEEEPQKTSVPKKNLGRMKKPGFTRRRDGGTLVKPQKGQNARLMGL
jgi:putative DNA primase/helicase